MLNCRLFPVLAGIALLSASWVAAPAATLPSTAEVAQRFARDIAVDLNTRAAGVRDFRVLVYPMGNFYGETPRDILNFCMQVTSELNGALDAVPGARYLVIDEESMMRRFRQAGITGSEIDYWDPDSLKSLLTRLDAQAIVFGYMHMFNVQDAVSAGRIPMEVWVGYDSGHVEGFYETDQDGAANTSGAREVSIGEVLDLMAVLPPVDPVANRRIVTADLYVDGERLPYYQCRRDAPCRSENGAAYRQVYFVRLNRGRHQNKEYAVHIRRTDNDPHLIGVAGAVDGISIFMDPARVGADSFVRTTPSKDAKWLLSPYLSTVECAGNMEFNLMPYEPGREKSWEMWLRGFQYDDQQRLLFRFTETDDSVGSLSAARGENGSLQLHFFRDKRYSYPAWDQVSRSEAGSIGSRREQNQTCSIRFDTEPEPRYSIKVIYAYEDESFPVPDEDLIKVPW